MSLILEALKRAERERKRKQTPDLRSVLWENEPGGRRFRPWFYILCIVLVVVVIVTARTFWTKEPAPPPVPVKEPARSAEPVKEKKTRQAPEEPSLEPENPFAMLAKRAAERRAKRSRPEATEGLQEFARALEQVKVGPAEDSSDAGPIEPAAADEEGAGRSRSTGDEDNALTRFPGVPARASTKKRPVEKAKRASNVIGAPEDDSAFVQPGEEAAGRVVPPESIPTIYELPPDIQLKLEDLSLNVHAYYDDPDKRFVYINMKRYQAGDRIGDKTGPLLEEIIPEGVIIDYGEGKARLLTTR